MEDKLLDLSKIITYQLSKFDSSVKDIYDNTQGVNANISY